MPESIVLEAGREPVAGYRLLARLGRGGFGEVWKAQSSGGFPVALKFVHLDSKSGNLELRTLDILKSIRHGNLLSTFDAWKLDSCLVMAMELADRTLLDRLNEALEQGLPGIPRDELLEYMREAAKGLDFLNGHQHTVAGKDKVGIQHRDVKPQNLLLVGNSVKVADFGLSRLLESTATSHTGALTVAYAAPEFFNGQTCSQSDQYSLAVTYCELRSGRLPYGGGSAVQIMAAHIYQAPDLSMLPAEERPIVERALAKEPTHRWLSCRAFVDELRTARIPRAAPPPPVVTKGSKPLPPPPPPAPPRVAKQVKPTTTLPPEKKTLPTPVAPPAPSLPASSRRLTWIIVALSIWGSVSTLLLLLWALGLLPSGSKRNQDARQESREPSAPSSKTSPLAGSEGAQAFTNSLGMKLISIAPGEFQMGSDKEKDSDADDDELPRHPVRITQRFWIAAHKTTQEQLDTVLHRKPSHFSATGNGKDAVTGRDTSHYPVESLSWYDAIEFCIKLSEVEQRKPCYRLKEIQRAEDGGIQSAIVENLSEGNGYRLPSEAEREYCARAGETTRYSFGEEASRLDEFAWFAGNSNDRPHPVGEKKPNAWGLYDMAGLALEWCEDAWHPDYESAPSEGGAWRNGGQQDHRTTRGGSWKLDAKNCRSAYRQAHQVDAKDNEVGFRVVLVAQ